MKKEFERSKLLWQNPETRRKIYFGAFIALVIAGIYHATAFGSFPEQGDHYGFWSVMPPLVAIVLAFWTREVVSALFIGVCLGGVIAGDLNVVQVYLIPSIGTESFALILLVYLWALGGLIGIWTRTGGAERFAVWASDLMVRGPRSAKFFTWMMGLIFHQGGTISTVLTGATVRPVADKHKVSHEELAYMVDSTASPAATLIPFNVWPIYVSGLVIGTLAIFETPQDGINFFFASLPYNFYAIFAILITLGFALEVLPWVPGKKMRKAVERSRTTGLLDRKGSTPMAADELVQSKVPDSYHPGLIDFFGPIGALLGVAIIPYAYTFFILGSDEPLLLIAEAFVLAVLAGIFIAIAKGMPLQIAINGFIDGCKGVTIGAIILALAVTLKEVADAVGTAAYVVEMIGDLVIPSLLPGVLMILCMIIAFSTGTSWGTYAVVFPIAVPLAWAVVPDVFFLQLSFAAVIGGSVMGDQCSPISDTTILSSLSTGCDLMDHVTTQLPLALTAGFFAAILYALLVVTLV
ncbi:Na+/H+ antiporter NhaC family protein [Rhodohalobacter mucosus]|uniref:Sodium:proton antiporter n=1 Tax=Rhodohalobacter mucosus TaxID=2079485 RepID=A0A316TPE6_9BACT|nr:Na+/H+ antiporter NhaC family protein [Rhodohalobacter mucosus]PWN05541.1 sodium:proton antiporter [Rhodohalobacter mucosus]